MRRSTLFVAMLVTSIGAPVALADDGTGVLFVAAVPAGTCEIDESVRGPSPVVARVAPGEHSVTCRSQLDGVTVTRSAKATVQSGKGTKVTLAMKVAP